MSYSTTPLGGPVGNQIVTDTALGAAPDTNVRNGATTVFTVEIDNTLNSGAVWVLFYDNAAPTVGTTSPDYVLRVNAGLESTEVNTRGWQFLTAMSMAAVNSVGGTTSPILPVRVSVICS